MRLLLIDQDIEKGNALVIALGKKHHYVRWARMIAQAELFVRQYAFDGAIVSLNNIDEKSAHEIKHFIKQRIKIPTLYLDEHSGTDVIISELRDLIQYHHLLQHKRLQYRQYIFEPEHCLVRDKQSVIFLSPTESLIFEKLITQAGKIVQKMELLHAMKANINSDPNKVEVVISALRKKLPNIAIETVHLVGYRIE